MTTAYTSLLGLALPVTGELQGTWGDVVNDSITSLLDTAIAGTTSLTTDTDTTLSDTDGASNQSRQAVVLWNPASGTVTRNITAPARSKTYVVINATGGTQSIVFRGVGPTTGVTILAGEKAVVAWNGSDFVKVSTFGGSPSFTNVTVTGTTTLSGLTASTALALNGSKEVVSVTNTGTGNNVLSASPTLTGTVAGASLTLSSLTSGRVTYAGASGLITDSANFTFNGTDLTVSGAVNAGSINATTLDLTNLEVTNIKAKDGTSAATIADSTGVVSFTANPVMSGGTANGVTYLNGSKVLTSGSALTFDGTTFGMTVNALFNNSRVLQWKNTSGVTRPVLQVFSDNNLYIDSEDGAQIFRTLGSEQMRLTSTGLGLGTTSPQTRLVVSNGSNENIEFSSGSVAFNGGVLEYINRTTATTRPDFNYYLGVSGAHKFYISGSEQMRLTSTGLGIGTSSPLSRLSVQQSADGFDQGLTLSRSGADRGTVFLNASNNTLNFGRATATSMTLNASGNLGLEITPSAWGAAQKALEVGAYAALVTDATGNALSGLMNNLVLNGTTYSFKLAAPAYAGAYLFSPGLGNHQWLTSSGPGTGPATATMVQAMTLDLNGNLGIGTSSPAYKLDIQGAAGVGVRIIENTTGTSKRLQITQEAAEVTYNANYSSGTNAHAWQIGNLERMRLDASGNLGLGVTPSAWGSSRIAIQIAGASFAGVVGSNTFNELSANRYINSSGQDIYIGTGAATVFQQTNGAYRWLTAPSGTAGNAISFTQAMTLDASGNLGIGTTSPVQKLVVSNGGAAGLEIGPTIVNSAPALVSYNRSGGAWMQLTYSALSHVWQGSGSEVMRLDASGNLGLGVTPSAIGGGRYLQFLSASSVGQQANGTANLMNNAYESSGNSFSYIVSAGAARYNVSSDTHAWFIAPFGTAGNAISFTQAMTLDASGNLLVGATSNPGVFNKSVVVNSGADTLAGVVFQNNTTGTGSTDGSHIGIVSSDMLVVNCENAPIRFFTNNTERARITSDGNLLVGTTDSGATTGTGFKAAFPSATNPSFRCVGASSASSESTYELYSTGATAYRFYVNYAGTVFATTTTISAISDQRFKENIQDLDVGLNAVMALKPRKFDWKAGKGKDIKGDRGFIAQEFEQVFPDLIDAWKDPAPEGETPYKSVRQDLIPVLVKAIQEQQAIIEQLKARLDAANL